MNRGLLMQYLKPELREKIFDAATREFYLNGFKGANMRIIAQEAGMTVGNVYRYFKSKEHLLDEIVKKTYLELLSVIRANYERLTKQEEIQKSIERLVRLWLDHHDVIVIILLNSEGSKYENVIEEFKKAIMNRIKEEFKMIDVDILEIMTNGLIGGIKHILQKYPHDSKRVQALLHNMVSYFFEDFEKRIGGF